MTLIIQIKMSSFRYYEDKIMISISLADIAKNNKITEQEKKQAYERLNTLKKKNEQLEQSYAAKGSKKPEIIV